MEEKEVSMIEGMSWSSAAPCGGLHEREKSNFATSVMVRIDLDPCLVLLNTILSFALHKSDKRRGGGDRYRGASGGLIESMACEDKLL